MTLSIHNPIFVLGIGELPFIILRSHACPVVSLWCVSQSMVSRWCSDRSAPASVTRTKVYTSQESIRLFDQLTSCSTLADLT